MTELDRLPPDQRAVLSLVLDRGKSYAEVAELLGIPEGAVRDRAHAALDALADAAAPRGSSRTGSGRGARPGSERAAGCEAGRGEVQPPHRGSRPQASGLARRGAGPAPPVCPTTPTGAHSPQTSTGSRRAGALLLGAIVVVIVVVVVLVSSGGGKGSTPTTAASTTTSTTGTGTTGTSSTSTSSSSAKPKLDRTIRLSSTEPSVNAAGLAYVLSRAADMPST